jgi:uncharacterized protein (TIGR03382 family)
MTKWWQNLSLLLLLFAVPSVASASVLWRGDFETGDLSQWSKTQQVSSDRIQVIRSPTRQGAHAVRVEVRQGDNPIGASGNRNEMLRMTNETEGDERYYSWSTLFPSDYPLSPTWQVFTQWHHSGDSGAPPVRFVLGCSAGDCGVGMPDTVFFIVTGHGLWTLPHIQLGVWHDFVLHVKWSSSASVGLIELWYDGQQVVPQTNVATLFAGQTCYLKQGLYRDAATEPVQVVYHDNFLIGTSLADVLPTPGPSPTPGPTPGPDAATPAPGPDGATPTTPGPDAAEPQADAGVAPKVDSGQLPVEPVQDHLSGCSSAGGSLAALTMLPLVLAGLFHRRSRRD